MAMLDFNVAGKVAFISASVSGIGLATAQSLAALGVKVWINGRRQDRLDAARLAVLERVPNAKVECVLADVATAEGCKTIIDAVPDLDILINNAGGTSDARPFEELPDENWNHQWNFNVMSAVRLSRHYVPVLKKKDFGRIVFVSSETGLVTENVIVDYGVCKAALNRLSRCVAEIFKGAKGVTVNCVAPGGTLSDWVIRESERLGQSLEEFEAERFQSPHSTSLLGRFAEADEVANLIVYLCTPAANATRGALLRVEGGAVRTD